ncbi:MAG TPA: hypothetical protein PLD59_03050, partial [Tepidisphaeraceae bacterium]|nr:hypothetical protein [Tepidisphaeraceae bacterium]
YLGPAHWLDAINPPMQGNIDRLATNINALLMRGSGPGTASGASTIGITSQPHVGPGVTRDPSTPKPVSVPPIRSSQSAAPAIPRSPPPRVPPTNFPPSVGVEQPLADNVRIVLYLASGFVPILGFVLFFLYKDKPAASDRKAAQICLIVGICSFVLSVLFGCLCVLAGSAAEGY